MPASIRRVGFPRRVVSRCALHWAPLTACDVVLGSLRKVVLAAYDVFAALACAAILAFAWTTPAFAYVDPSVMTYAIQAVAGVAVALSTVAGVAFRRTRKKIFKVLGIDEEARKEHEPRYHHLDASGQPVITGADLLVESAAAASRAAGKSSVTGGAGAKGGVFAAVAVSVFAAFTLCVVAPYELVAGSAGSLVVSLRDIWSIMALAGLAVAAILAVVLLLVRGKVRNVAVVVVFAFGLCCYVQAMFMNAGLPQADGSAIDWSSFTGQTALSSAVWVALVAVFVVLAVKAPRKTRVAAGALSVVLVLVQAVGVATLFAANGHVRMGGEGVMVSQKGLFDVSRGSNIVEFVLDDFDTSLLKEAVREEPSLFDGFDDFTWFQNSAGSMIPTRYGNVFLLTGQYPHEDEPFSSFLKNRYARSTYLQDIDDAGYSIGIYSDTLGDQYLTAQEAQNLIYRHTESIGEVGASINGSSTALAFMQCALYRDMPWAMKPLFWFYTDDINNRIFDSGQNNPADAPYLMSDAAFRKSLNEQGLSFNDEQASYRYVHILGAHGPFSLDRAGNSIGVGNSTKLDQAIGSMRIVGAYVAQLKQLGVYDDATIVITSDHDTWWSQTSDLDAPKSPILLAKPSHVHKSEGADNRGDAHSRGEGVAYRDDAYSRDGASADGLVRARADGGAGSDAVREGVAALNGESSSAGAARFAGNDVVGGVRVSFAPVSAGTILATIAQAAGVDASEYGQTLFQADRNPDYATPRYFYMTANNGVHDVSIDKYEITGDVSDISNWRKTNVFWQADR